MVNYWPSSVTYAVTKKCNSKCKLCCMDGKQEEDIPNYLVMKGIGQSADAGIKLNDITGGEPLLRIDDIVEFAKYARSKGSECGTMTNSSFAVTPEAGYSTALRLKDSGLDNMGFSLDVDHQEYIPFSSVVNGIKGALDAGIENIGIHVTKRKSTADKNLELLDRLLTEIDGKLVGEFAVANDRPIYFHFGVMNRVGNASKLPDSEFYLSKENRSGCDETSMTVRNDGEIVACCSPYSLLNNGFSAGNIRDIGIEEAIKKINGSVIDFIISPMGLERARNIIRNSGNKQAKKILTKKYSIYCEQCNEILSSPAREVIESEMKKFEGIDPSLIFEEGANGTKVKVDTGSQVIDIDNYAGIISNRDFWTQAMEHKRRMVIQSGKTGKKTENFKNYLSEEIERALKLPKVEC